MYKFPHVGNFGTDLPSGAYYEVGTCKYHLSDCLLTEHEPESPGTYKCHQARTQATLQALGELPLSNAYVRLCTGS